jgi:choline dehydrogenase-like flavoprotein
MPQDTLNVNGKGQAKNTFDAIVIGSGISGGWAAKELCEKGLKTLVLERGRNVEHIKDYPTATMDPWEFKHRRQLTKEMKENQFIQIKGFCNEANSHFFVNDKEHPYLQVKPYDWLRGYHVGGRSLMWGRQCYRWSDLDFEANAKDGHGVDWPIRYRDIAPWYAYVERYVGISGSKDGLPQLPDGDFLPPMEMNCLEKYVAESIKTNFPERRMIIGRVANLSKGLRDRGPCQFRNQCDRGCPFTGYFSSNGVTLPAARATGNLTLRPFSIASEILYDKEKKRAIGVRVVDAETMKTEEFYAKIIFLNASTLNSTFVLLNSISDAFPNGMGNQSDQLGRNLMDHHYHVGAFGTYEGFQDQYVHGRRANGIYVPRFRNINTATTQKDYLRGFGYQGGGGRSANVNGDGTIGVELKESAVEPGVWAMGLYGFGEQLPHPDNKVTLSKEKKDKWGLPLLAIDAQFRENEKAMRMDMMNSAGEMLEKAGLKNIQTYNQEDANPGLCIHEMGTARMGKDPKTSVLNKWNQLHEVKNVFVTDGACMVSSANQNPSVTYMALTARACDFAVNELKKGNI